MLGDNVHRDHLVEYLLLFSNQGSIEVSVSFKGSKAIISNKKMHPEEISQLIDRCTGQFIKEMTFDERPAQIKKIEMLPCTNKLVIHAQLDSA